MLWFSFHVQIVSIASNSSNWLTTIFTVCVVGGTNFCFGVCTFDKGGGVKFGCVLLNYDMPTMFTCAPV